jgi:uncharacterized protein
MQRPTGIPTSELELVDHVLALAWRRDSHLHGEAHWHAVTATGLDLAAGEPGADPELLFLFGLLHDTRRQSDGRDREHGPRAAAFAVELHADGAFELDAERLALLFQALERHAFGEVSDDPRIGACWDADRLHLPRVGFDVNPSLLSTAAARDPEALAAAARRRSERVAWEPLIDRLLG